MNLKDLMYRNHVIRCLMKVLSLVEPAGERGNVYSPLIEFIQDMAMGLLEE